MMRAVWVAIAFLFFATAARAEWHEATSENFVVYANTSPKELKTFSELLERYHAALEFLTRTNTAPPSPSNRVTIYAVGTEGRVQSLVGKEQRNVAGFYIPRAGKSVAFVPTISVTYNEMDFTTTILLHEYTHHFLLSQSRFAMPRWYNEGAAEFFSSATFNRDGGIKIGRPATHRAAELFLANNVPLEELFDHDLYEKRRSKQFDAFYGRAWLLFHYLIFSNERRSQFTAYTNALIAGTPSPEAARQSFGDLKVLEKELSKYLGRPRLSVLELSAEDLAITPVSVRKLSEGHAAVMQPMIRSQRGINEETAPQVLAEIQKVSARYPDDPWVNAALAEALHDTGRHDEAIAAADKAIATDPSQVNAYVQKGFALFAKARDAEDRQTAYREAMKPFSALNRIENDHPLPLIHYYLSFVEQGLEPPEQAQAALVQAYGLAPFESSLAMMTGMMYAKLGMHDRAIHALEPLAAHPHGGSIATKAKELIETLRNKKEGESYTDSDLTIEEVAPAEE